MVVAARLATEAPAGVSSAIRRGSRRSVTTEAVPYRLSQPKVGEKSGFRPNPPLEVIGGAVVLGWEVHVVL